MQLIAHPASAVFARILVCTAFIALLGNALPVRGQVSKEYQLKAVLLFRLAQFVEWPTNRFASAESPVVIGVLGRNPFGEALQLAVQGETAHGRRIEIRQVRRMEEAADCHIVFISASEEQRVREFTAGLAGKAVLTVSDIENFARGLGGMVRFFTVEKKVNLRINVDRAKAAGLMIDSRLLRMADIVRDE